MADKKSKPRIRRTRDKVDIDPSAPLPTYKDVRGLSKFVDDRGKILARSKTGLSAKRQRIITREIKRARFLALMPFAQVL